MRRAVVYGAIAALTLGLLLDGRQGEGRQESRMNPASVVYASSVANANRGPCFGPDYEVKHSMSTERQHRNVRNLIACATRRWTVPGGYATALRIATCESSLYAWAYSNGNAGLFQIRSWAERASYWLKHRWFPFHWLPRWQLARANVLVAVRWASRLGWSAWSCY